MENATLSASQTYSFYTFKKTAAVFGEGIAHQPQRVYNTFFTVK
jgi:hypothetical protein